MTEKNADVEWLRQVLDDREYDWPVVEPSRGRRLLAHIDQLERSDTARLWLINKLEAENARLIEAAEDKIDINVRPTIHEIAPQMMAAFISDSIIDWEQPIVWPNLAGHSYDAAEALVAEGRRRDGLRE